jgi:hypothetical protein
MGTALSLILCENKNERVLEYLRREVRASAAFVQSEEVKLLTERIRRQEGKMRSMAYHQAVTELEGRYPLDYRSMIPGDTWENLIDRETDLILKQVQQLE